MITKNQIEKPQVLIGNRKAGEKGSKKKERGIDWKRESIRINKRCFGNKTHRKRNRLIVWLRGGEKRKESEKLVVWNTKGTYTEKKCT